MTNKNVRSSVYLSPELDKKILERSEEMGIAKSVFMNLAIQAGYEAISLAVNPGLKEIFESQIAIEGKNAKKIIKK